MSHCVACFWLFGHVSEPFFLSGEHMVFSCNEMCRTHRHTRTHTQSSAWLNKYTGEDTPTFLKQVEQVRLHSKTFSSNNSSIIGWLESPDQYFLSEPTVFNEWMMRPSGYWSAAAVPNLRCRPSEWSADHRGSKSFHDWPQWTESPHRDRQTDEQI